MSDTLSIFDIFSESEFAQAQADKMVAVKTHPYLPLRIANYTPAAQYSRTWNDVTRNCRGLIFDKDNNVLARPFPKFFNWGEVPDHPELQDISKARIFDKADGSLGILYTYEGVPYIATRGSFTSDQAIWATEFFNDHYRHTHDTTFSLDYTYLFEIVYPENRIVLDYQGFSGLIGLTAVHTQTGKTEHHEINVFPGPIIDEYSFENPHADLFVDRPNKEGYVLLLPSGDRIKVKHEEYVRLHKIFTGLTSRTVYEHLASGGVITDLLDDAPDEMHEWILNTGLDLQDRFNELEVNVRAAYRDICDDLHQHGFTTEDPNYRREFAARARLFHHTAPLFTLLDNRSIDEYVWKQIKPATTTPFREEAE